MFWAFWQFQLVPNKQEREAFVNTLTTTAQQNADSNEKIATATEEIKDSVQRQEHTQEKESATMIELSGELKKQTKMREVAMETMTAFTEKVHQERGDREILLNKILDKCTENGNHTHPTNP